MRSVVFRQPSGNITWIQKIDASQTTKIVYVDIHPMLARKTISFAVFESDDVLLDDIKYSRRLEIDISRRDCAIGSPASVLTSRN
jgi:hypothetical protein